VSALRVQVKRLPNYDGLDLPTYATAHSAGMDLLAANDGARSLSPGERGIVSTGIAISLPPGFEAQIRPRSGLALKHGITVLNSPGTIDDDYRGEIAVILINLGTETFIVEPGMRIAQMVIGPVKQTAWDEVAVLSESERGDGGFGSTGDN
jgi:dUTP pyrophosphatase